MPNVLCCGIRVLLFLRQIYLTLQRQLSHLNGPKVELKFKPLIFPVAGFSLRIYPFSTIVEICVEVEVTFRLTVSQYVLVSSTLVGLATRYYFLSECCCSKVAALFLWDSLSDERAGLQFAVQSLNGPSRTEPATILRCLI
jgi:hypothetical protein